MGDYGNFGPDWFWELLGILIAFGIISLIYLIAKGMMWAMHHITIT